ncbi:hypothetical protein [Staphylococcus hominis]|uniref:hypothetical protein n=1 Tax=Staphylococcus hominis TaxID=1290 RepID=UPI0006B9BCAF|nr:hypothetical protein [Staphylococcus hominis]OFN15208.1 hypothetical protein HMPREF2612_05930 [Staphylococcus sp. HMSC058D09]KPG90129.1 hypothetical protein AEQ58_04285 [Staphylococcus hominis]MCI2882715.1 hypothetical protein [Staphylococcus hominis]MCI2918776.1 hypothetical protein [Staphylococcus hominis]MDS3926981.1 hypothetical protein [Staphylococcus hominis]
MIDIQIQKCDLIEVIGSIINEKVEVENQDACEYLATEIVNGLEDYNSEETQANNLLGLNSELRHEVKESNHAKKVILSANEDTFSVSNTSLDTQN